MVLSSQSLIELILKQKAGAAAIHPDLPPSSLPPPPPTLSSFPPSKTAPLFSPTTISYLPSLSHHHHLPPFTFPIVLCFVMCMFCRVELAYMCMHANMSICQYHMIVSARSLSLHLIYQKTPTYEVHLREYDTFCAQGTM
jgi:hypothetical protein